MYCTYITTKMLAHRKPFEERMNKLVKYRVVQKMAQFFGTP